MDAGNLVQKPAGYIHETKVHHELSNIKIPPGCLRDRSLEINGVFCADCFVLTLGFRHPPLASEAGHWVRWCSTFSGTYFLIPLYSLIPGNLSAFVLLVISLFWAQHQSSWIHKMMWHYHYGIVNIHQKCKATHWQLNYWQACHELSLESRCHLQYRNWSDTRSLNKCLFCWTSHSLVTTLPTDPWLILLALGK